MSAAKKRATKNDLIYKLYKEMAFGGYTKIDGTIQFYTRVNSLLRPTDVALDIGCGRGDVFRQADSFHCQLRNLKGKCSKVIGIDVDPEACVNPSLDEFHLLDSGLGRWPLEDTSVQLCLSDQVMEHVDDPNRFFLECDRVLAPGGHLCFRTTNAHGYVALAARVIPDRWHIAILKKVQPLRLENDVYPTYFRCNTVNSIKQQLRKFGYESCLLLHEGEPSYLAFSIWAFRLGQFLHWILPGFMSNSIFVFARKPFAPNSSG